MKQAFSLLELVFCIVILSFVFGSYYLIFANKSLNIIW
ncbi:TPA: prepilin-type N-terminal cleavage/methylation domain-containing protein [Campylobacter lari]|nr:prepilin-type N-terminal cleavage/methylation domain-containing protein [Campylobacter lari]